MGVIFDSVPIGSLTGLPAEKRLKYTESVFQLPGKVRVMLFAPNTGAFTRGLVKGYGLAEEKSAVAALAVLRVAIGEKAVAQLPSLLSTELKLPNDKAQAMAREIEQDLFGPVRKELEEYWRRDNKGGASPFAGGQVGETRE